MPDDNDHQQTAHVAESSEKPDRQQRLIRLARSAGWLLLVFVLTAAAHALLAASQQVSQEVQIDEIAHRVQYQIGHAISNGDMREFDLGEFHTSVYRSDIDATLRLDFRLSLVVESKDAARFEKLLHASRHRLRDASLAVVNNIGTQELIDPNLRELKAAIAAAANEICGQQIVATAAFADYSYIDQT